MPNRIAPDPFPTARLLLILKTEQIVCDRDSKFTGRFAVSMVGGYRNRQTTGRADRYMGRGAVHSGKMITWDEAMASNFQFYPEIDTMDYDTPPPVLADAEGRYPVPVPGVWSEM